MSLCPTQHAAEELCARREVLRVAVKLDRHFFPYTAEEVRAERENGLLAVKQNGPALWNAAKEVGASKGIDMMALCGLDKADPDSTMKLALLSFDKVTGIEHFGKQKQQQQQLQLIHG